MSSEAITRNDLSAILNEVLPNPADMTPQEVEDFVDELNLTASKSADYVVEQGTEGIWTYRKWQSGIAECWGEYDLDFSSVTSAWGSLYFSPYHTILLPTNLFITTPVTTMTRIRGYEGWVGNKTLSKDAIGDVYLIRPLTVTIASTTTIAIMAKGRWK